MDAITRVLNAIEHGDPHAAEQLLPLVYDELRKLAAERMAQEKPGQTLQATALVHEAYLRLVGGEQTQDWDGRRHFFAAAAEAMRRILIDRARHKQTRKAGGGRRRLDLDDIEPALEEGNGDRLLALDEALRQLEAEDPRKAELVKLRFFAGLTAEQAAAALGVSTLHRREGLGVRPKLAPGGDRPHVRTADPDRLEKTVTGLAPVSRIVLWTGPPPGRGDSHDRVTARQRGDLPRRPGHPRPGPPAGVRPGGVRRGRGPDRPRRGPAGGRRHARQPAGPSGGERPRRRPRPACRKSPGTVIGPYKLLEQIGEGGMGTVWMAQQTEPVKRLVAVKLIKAGMDSRQVIARFEAERQALALMDHPNIAKVLDAGATPERPAVLRHGAGQGRADHPVLRRAAADAPRSGWSCSCRSARRCSTRTRRASSTATSSPPTCWSRLYDGKPVAKVIDFGVAKAAGQPLTDRTLVTGFGAVVGTLEYMSPEQAELEQPRHRHPQRHLLAGRAAVRAADRHDAAADEAAGAGRLRWSAADHPRGGAAEAEHAS